VTRLPNAAGPGGREVGPPWVVAATAPAASSGASSAEPISQVASTPAKTTAPTTMAMAAPAGPPTDRRRGAS
jgi:hypothetical protein